MDERAPNTHDMMTTEKNVHPAPQTSEPPKSADLASGLRTVSEAGLAATNTAEASAAQAKLAMLKARLTALGSLLVAYSGGVDSTFLLDVAREVLPAGRVLAVTAASPTYFKEEVEEAERVGRAMGVRHAVIESHEFELPEFRANPPDRCYHCKKDLFTALTDMAKANGLAAVADGANASDLADYRPGARAGAELGVISPLQEVGLTKDEIRLLSRERDLPTWNKPALACLASRFPYGAEITADALRRVGGLERFLHGLGFTQVRARHHDAIVRLELVPAEMEKALAHREAIAAEAKRLGYTYCALDLLGYRTGSMNLTLPAAQR